MAASRTRRTDSSVPPSEVPTATSEPSSLASNQSMATAASAAPVAGSSRVAGAVVASAAERRESRNCSAPAGRSRAKSRSPRTCTPIATGSCSSCVRWSCQRSPVGAVHDRTGDEVLRLDPGSPPPARRRPPTSGTGPRPRHRGGRRRRRHDGSSAASTPQPRPMLGRLPWLALDRRSRALRFFVFFDMGRSRYRRHQPERPAQAGSAPSMAATSLGSSGATIGLKRVTLPCGSTRNFSKFQRMSPSWPSSSATAVSSV